MVILKEAVVVTIPISGEIEKQLEGFTKEQMAVLEYNIVSLVTEEMETLIRLKRKEELPHHPV